MQDLEYVLRSDCNTKHVKLEVALLGDDGTGLHGGIVKDITDIKRFMEKQSERNTEENNQKQGENQEARVKKRDYRKAIMSFLFAVVGGGIVALINYLLNLH